jgi:hypothetical protein
MNNPPTVRSVGFRNYRQEERFCYTAKNEWPFIFL